MIKYVSGNFMNRASDPVPFTRWLVVEKGYPVLASAAHPKALEERTAACIEAVRNGGRPRILYDSGAFSAWNSGTPMSLEKLIPIYDRVMEQLPEQVDAAFVSLDKIPGAPDRHPTEDEVVAAQEESLRNYELLFDRYGARILPVWRSGESVSILEKYLAIGATWVCFSMMQTLSEDQRVMAAAKMFRALNGRARVHGLAATGAKMMGLSEWYSVDSASWQFAASMGSILIDRGSRLIAVAVSQESPGRKTFGKAFDSMSSVEQQWLMETVAARGFDIDRLRTDYRQRWRWNVITWQEFEPPAHDPLKGGLFDE